MVWAAGESGSGWRRRRQRQQRWLWACRCPDRVPHLQNSRQVRLGCDMRSTKSLSWLGSSIVPVGVPRLRPKLAVQSEDCIKRLWASEPPQAVKCAV